MSLPLSIAIAQIDSIVGDISGNAEKILRQYRDAAKRGADLVICPELSLIGYPPEDLVLLPAFQKAALAALKKLAAATNTNTALVVGSVWKEKDKIYNAAVLLGGGKILHVQYKHQLPNYGIFDEKRIFSTGEKFVATKWKNQKIGLLVCEDIWTKTAAMALKKQGAKLLISINASPFEIGKLAQRKKVVAAAAKATKLPVVYANLVGGQDDIVFDGGSFVMSSSGKVTVQLPEFEESMAIVEREAWNLATCLPRTTSHVPRTTLDTIWSAMKLGLADYVGKNHFGGVVLGLSGGIDSAVTAACAVDALGAAKVKGVLLPSPYTSKESIEDALASAKLLGIETMTIPITPGMALFDELLSPVFRESNWMEDVSLGGNVQSRLRGMTLMAVSNRFGGLLLSTGNKSEIAVGYTTLYGDSCGGYNVLKDLYKTQIYALAHWRNQQGAVIPKRSITKAPSAELAPGQKDEDQLPPYALLDKILAHYLEGRLGVDEIVAKGFKRAVVEKVAKMVRQSEYKRRQSCPGVKISPMLFGRDRRFPLTNVWKG